MIAKRTFVGPTVTESTHEAATAGRARPGHADLHEHLAALEAAGLLLTIDEQVNATLRRDAPPVSLPERRYMEAAKGSWERLGLPALRPEAPWHGYSLGQWSDEWEAAAARAADGGYLENGRISYQKRRADVAPNTAVGDVVEPGGDSEQG